MFKNMKIGIRLTLAFMAAVLFTLAVSVLAIARMGEMAGDTNDIVNDRYPKVIMTTKIIDHVNIIGAAIRDAVLFDDSKLIDAEIADALENRKKIKELVDKLESYVRSDKGRELFGKLKEERLRFIADTDVMIDMARRNADAEAVDYLQKTYHHHYDAYLESINNLIKHQEESVVKGGKEAEVTYAASRNIVIILALVSALISIVLGFWITRSITRPLQEAVDVANAVAKGDLTQRIEVTSTDEAGQLLQALKAMNENLTGIVTGVRGTTESITVASQEIAQGNADLSQRTEEQASSLEETASSMEELTSTVRQNTENAKQANQLAANASDIAVKGGKVVGDVVHTMASISTSSKKIADIISVIDSIAFQTNILALNAAVEAARAGEQGRGFAVVAGEVRNLAQRSAAAAKEIKTLIDDSVSKVDVGSRQVDQAGATMSEIVQAVKRVTDIMSEIAAASNEQSAGIEQVNQAITQMDEVTQQNAALVEEAAAAAEAMQEQAGVLMKAVSVFKLQAGSGNVRASASKLVARQPIARQPSIAVLQPQ